MKVQVGSINTAYYESSEGRVVVLLHGWATSKENMLDIANRLEDSYRVIVVDMPGFGETDMPPLNWNVSDYVDFVKSFLTKIGVENVFAFVSHSFGGRVCIKGISSEKLKSEKLILVGSAGVGHSKSLRNVAYKVVAKSGKQVMKLPFLRNKYDEARKRLHEKTGSDDYANSGEMRQVFLNTINEDLSEDIKQLKLPTLLIWGSEDTEAPLADARFMNENIEGSQIKIIQGAGHFVHNEHPDKVARFIKEFL